MLFTGFGAVAVSADGSGVGFGAAVSAGVGFDVAVSAGAGFVSGFDGGSGVCRPLPKWNLRRGAEQCPFVHLMYLM